jgi:PAS domain S-box-containing protein
MKTESQLNRRVCLAFGSAILALTVVGTICYQNMARSGESGQTRTVLLLGTTLALLITAFAGWSLLRRTSGPGQAEEALRDSEEKYRMLLDGVQDHAIFMLDPEGQVVSWNAGAERIKGYTAEEIIGRNFSCFFPADDVERGRPQELLRITARSGRHEEQGTRVRKDGSRFLENVTFTALRDPAGNLRGFSEISRDLSESKESGAKYRGLLEAAPDAMVVVNQGGDIVLLNVQAEKQFGYSRDELVGQKVKNIIPEGFAERLVADALRSTEDALAQQIGTGIELTGRHKNGSDFPIEIMLSPLESAEGILVTAAIRDISTRMKAEANLLQKVDELNRSNEELGQFAYIASHDLQEPLRMVASYTQLLSRRYKGKLDADADEFIAFAVDGASRMQRLIQDLLAYSRVGTKGRDLLDTSSEEALQQALVNLRGAIEESGAQVTHGPLPAVMADEMQLVQLFQNLVGDAIKYQGPGIPQVHVAAARNGGNKWTFSVQDNGLGIDSQYFEKIFGMFQRLHKREEFAGTGIGLAICKKIVERHGGSIGVESQPGQGSTFRFALAESGKKL